VNEIVRQWPKGRALSYVHVPLAMPGERASTDRRFYESLRRLNLPQEVRFVAGFVDGRLSEDDHTRILRTIEGILKRSVDVSSPCGFERGGTASCEDLLVTTANLVR
jgi:hypothetical protein